jgi:subtilase family serine protease
LNTETAANESKTKHGATVTPPVRAAAVVVVALLVTLSGLFLAPSGSARATLARAVPDSYAAPDGVVPQPSGFSPAELEAAYGLSTSPFAGAGQTIAIVDAFDNANVAAELSAFDAFWDLPVCGPACFTKVDQNGGVQYPSAAPSNWALEIAMDVEWAHAIAPGAHIILVEAASAGLSDLLVAERYAGAHAGYVSNSWGFPEFSGEAADGAAFAAPGVSYFAAVDDSPGKTQYPATAPSVVAVGGVQLTPTSTVPWTSGGGGCSSYEQVSSGQLALAAQAGCSGRQTTPAVSANAVGIPVLSNGSLWQTAGGTSFATVLWAAAAADSGQLVTNEAIASGEIPLRQVLGGSLLKTGLGNLGPITHTVGEYWNVASATIDSLIWS